MSDDLSKRLRGAYSTVFDRSLAREAADMIDTLLADLDAERANSYPHMCRMDHVQIGHRDSEGDEQCPLCVARAENEALAKDAARYKWLREHDAWLRPCYTERRGYRSTATDAKREVWDEFDGWLVSIEPIDATPHKTMDAAIDASMRKSARSGESLHAGRDDGRPE